MFVLFFSATDALKEHAQKSWPQATATIEKCSLDPYVSLDRNSHTPVWHIGCRIGYRADADQIETKIRSRSTSSWGGDIERMSQWLVRHQSGSTIVVRYDPKDHKTIALTETDMPDAGPRTPNNLKLLLISSAVFIGLWIVARWNRAAASAS